MSLLGRFLKPPPSRIAALDTQHAARLAAIHGTGFARPWSTLEFERLLGERVVIADGLFFGQSRQPDGFILSRAIIDEAEILTIALHPACRGRKLSGPLLTAHLEGLCRAGMASVHLEVEEGNVPALALYRRLGFRETGRREGYYRRADGTRASALTMRLDL